MCLVAEGPRTVPSFEFNVGGTCTLSRPSINPLWTKGLRASGAPPAAPQQRASGTNRHSASLTDPRLIRLCEVWASLPERVILAILALADWAGAQPEAEGAGAAGEGQRTPR